MEEMPPGSVVLDTYGDAWQNGFLGYWYRAYGDSSEVSACEVAQRGPIKKIHEGKTP